MSKENKTGLFPRLFIAIQVPRKCREHIYEKLLPLSEPSGDKYAAVKRIPPDNIHITLKFLGSTNAAKIDKIKNAISQTADSVKKFYYTIGEFPGAFPSLKAARIVYVPIVQGSEQISEIFSLIEDNLSKIKIRKEQRKFLVHITVARLKDMTDITGKISGINTGFYEPVPCSHIALYESILKPAGAEYNIIEEFELKKKL